MLGRLSLRARLILGVIVLTAAGLIVADLVTYTELRSFEIKRTDSSLDAAHAAVSQTLFGGPRFGPGDGNGNGASAPPAPSGGRQPGIGPVAASVRGYYVEFLHLNGTRISVRFIPQLDGETTPPAPSLPATLKLPTADGNGERVRYFTVGAVTGGTRYRVRASIERGAANQILVIAAPLSAVDSTLHRLMLVELIATASVLLGITLLGLWVVRLGLRPLDAMSKTADEIAAGDLSRRIEHATERTEVGRLGLALNSMLTQIEAAATARDASLSALEASESKLRRFVADASHELRTPLAAVRAYAELFGRGAASRPADLERSMTGISRESERMSVLVDDLLLLAHLDEGRPLVHEQVSLDEVVAEAIETARTLEPSRPIELRRTETLVAGDRDRLRQVIDNLLSNVRAHTPLEAPLTVTVEPADGEAVLTVADSGPGLEPEQVTHIFERFYRADPSRARASGGAGLGLAIVFAVVAAHGGTVAAESEPGVGTTFTVRLPLEQPEAESQGGG